jgi:L-alanine-DL-glutamate epimerase-like enolase superfamily enzyme
MKVTDVQAILLAIPLKDIRSATSTLKARKIVVKVFSDEGIVGIGEAFAMGAPVAVCDVIEQELKPCLLGEDPCLIEKIVEKLFRSTFFYTRRGLGLFAISSVEIALWDLLGKVRGLPVSALLGGPCETKVQAYASLLRYDRPEEVVEVAQKYVEQGFSAIKLHQSDLESVRAVRKAISEEIDLMLDVNCAWDPLEAVHKARALSEYKLRWLEEPVWPPEDYRGLAEVTAAAEVPIAAGENESTRYGFRELIALKAVNIVQPSLCRVGGLLEAKKISHLASSWNLPVIPHANLFGAGMAATIHFVASTPGSFFVEYPGADLEDEFLLDPPRVREGYLEVPTRPGLGVELNEEVAKRYRYPQNKGRT